MVKNVHLPFLIIAVFSVSATALSLLIQGDLDSTLTMLKVVLPVFAGIAAVLFVARKLHTSTEVS